MSQRCNSFLRENLPKLSLWKRFAILKHVQGKPRRQQGKLMLRRSAFLSSFSDKPLNSLPISSGSNCCSWKPFASRLRTTTNQAPLLSQSSFHGCHSKVGNCGGAGVRVPRVKEAGGWNPGMTLPSMLLLLHWDSVLLVLACSWDGLWGGCYPISRLSSSSAF